jgi:TetR/AcrR family transcriptional repressor of nem operon
MTSRPVPAAVAPTATRILDVAEGLAQTRGFNGFSYADIAADIGITKASLHYHFPSKAELGRALVRRYSERFMEALTSIEGSDLTVAEKLRHYVDLYEAVLVRNRMCLCGMLAAEYATLPEQVQLEVRSFFDRNEEWLTRVVEAGAREGAVRCPGTPGELARLLTGSLEGAMLLAYSYGAPERFVESAGRLLGQLLEPATGPQQSR